jgi:3-methyladenine DNA glycosylase/8-oxoguanine DNA glycosylase
MRSPTLFEDIIKTVTSCNVTWPSTIVMNRRLCEVLGKESASGGFAFVEPKKLARARPQTLRARCRVGYRDQRLIELAKLYVAAEKSRARDAADLAAQKLLPTPIVSSKLAKHQTRANANAQARINLPWLEDPTTPDDAVFKALVALPGIGPYAAANIMQLMGRYARLPLDTESVRHGKTLLGYKGTSAQIMKKVHAHYAPFGANAFRSYWLEMWAFYESKHGPAWTWERDTTGKMFTAAQLSK